MLGDFWLLKLQQRMSGSVDLQKILTAVKWLLFVLRRAASVIVVSVMDY